MKLHRALLVTALVLLTIAACTAPAFCKVIYVNCARPDDAGDGLTWNTAKQKVQSGLTLAVAGDEVWVAKGIYMERVALRLGVFLYGGFTGDEALREERQPKANKSILDGNKEGTVVTSPSQATRTTGIDGFTVRNGGSSAYGGYAGIKCYSSSPTISNNLVSCNVQCPGIICENSSAIITNNIISNNQNGGVYITGSGEPIVSNNVITGNSGQGGIRCGSSSYLSVVITNNTVVHNSAPQGGGLYVNYGRSRVANNVIAFNSSGAHFSSLSVGTHVWRNNNVFGNGSSDYSRTYADMSDISADPRFLSQKYGNSHIVANSPCIDAGWNDAPGLSSVDMDGQARTIGNTIDIGADEYDGNDPPLAPTVVVRVSPDGDDDNDGSDWSVAKRTIQAGIDAASALGGEVWVRAGTYTECIDLHPYVYLYGGFDGTESGREERDWMAHETIIDAAAAGTVICILAGDASTCVDGFTIVRGRGTGSSSHREYGSGIVCYGCSPTITHNTIRDNGPESYLPVGVGGGISCYYGSPKVVENMISGNKATYGYGSGIHCSSSSAVIRGNTIARNSGGMDGGGLYILGGTASISGNLFVSNSRSGIRCVDTAPTIEGNTIVSNGVGIACYDSSQPVIRTNVIKGNSQGVYCDRSSPVITGNTIIGNDDGIPDEVWTEGQSKAGAGGISCIDSSPSICNNIVSCNSSGVSASGGSPTLRSNCVSGNTSYDYSGLAPGTADVSASPSMADVSYGNIHLQPDSPCVDAGWPGAPGLPTKDIDGQQRTLGQCVDIGADEADGSVWQVGPTAIVRVSTDGNDWNSGATWALSKRTINGAVAAAAAVGGEVWTKAGTYHECVDLCSYAYLYGGFAGNEASRRDRNWCAARSVIDGGDRGIGVMTSLAGTLSCIDGFTIDSSMAGIYCCCSSPKIANNTIVGNGRSVLPDPYRSGIEGGLYCDEYASPIIINNVIADNLSLGVFINRSSPVLINNTIANNGWGICCNGFSPVLSNNVIASNTYGINIRTGTPVLTSNDLWGNSGYDYSGIAAPPSDISCDPLFLDAAAGDYHLTSTSPCINKGWNGAAALPLFDFDGEGRICQGTVDIGADEYWPGELPIASVKAAADGAVVRGHGPVVAAAFPDFLYIESPDRVSGIRVEKTAHGLEIGAVADVAGTVQTTPDGERCIVASSVDSIGSGSVKPVAMSGSVLGGGATGLQEGVAGGVGLNSIGILVTVWGRVLPELTTSDSFTVDDGSGRQIRCSVPTGVTIDPAWTYVGVTGVCSCEKVAVGGGSELHAIVRVRMQGDVVPF